VSIRGNTPNVLLWCFQKKVTSYMSG